MTARPVETDFSPQLVWGYNRRDRMATLAACQPDYDATDYRSLVHPDDLGHLTTLLRHHIREQRRLAQRQRQVVNIHRVRAADGEYRAHLSLITLTRDKRNRLVFLYGIDYPAPADAAVSPQPWPIVGSAAEARCAGADPFEQVWRCGRHFVSPSLFRMVDDSSGETVELSEKQARFIALLLAARDAGGNPAYVKREESRQKIFGTEPRSRLADNDIDQLVKFFRQQLGLKAIGTKRAYGHILTAPHAVCSGAELDRALTLLWAAPES